MFRVNARVPVVLCVRDAYTQEGEREREREKLEGEKLPNPMPVSDRGKMWSTENSSGFNPAFCRY
jgi:hypothetical protein